MSRASRSWNDPATPDTALGDCQRHMIWEHWMQSPVIEGASNPEKKPWHPQRFRGWCQGNLLCSRSRVSGS